MEHFDADRIRMILQKPDASLGNYPHTKIIYKMLQRMIERNGFNRWDKPYCFSVAEGSKRYQNLTIKQATVVGKILLKYVGQLVDIANEKQEVKADIPKNQKKKDAPEQLEIKVKTIRSLTFED